MKRLCLFLFIVFCNTSFADSYDVAYDRKAVITVLDSFHHAAAIADGKTYFSLLSDDAIFLGTDASERWNKDAFKAFAQPYFSQGKGWTYIAKNRHINFTQNQKVAFFDELLFNENYGHCRGSGLLVKEKTGWKISQYNLTITVPNGIAKGITKQIQAYEQKALNKKKNN